MTTYTRVYVSTNDANYAPSGVATYAAARSSTQATNTTAVTSHIGQNFTTLYTCSQYFPIFDTTAIPSGETAAILSLVPSSAPPATASADAIEVRAVSSTANKIAGGSLDGLTPYFGTLTLPTVLGRINVPLDITNMARTATCRMVAHSRNERLNVAPTAEERVSFHLGDRAGTVDDPYLQVTTVPLWEFVGISNLVEVTGTAHALVTTGISGTLQAGDLLVACISSRIASTTSVTLPTGGEWTLVSEQKNNNVLATGSAAASGLMAYCVRGASNPNLTFTHPTAPSVALGNIVAYRNVHPSSPKDTQTSFTTATSTTAVSGAGLTTTQDDDLIVAMCAGGQEAAWSVFNATDPAGASGFGLRTGAPDLLWQERIDSLTTTGVDTSLAIFDVVKATTGATGNLTATASVAAAHVVIAGAFKIAAAAPAPVTGTGTPSAQAATAASTGGISSSAGSGTPAAQAAALSGLGTAGDAAATGTGALAAGAATVSAAGISASVGIGALAAQAATVAGAAVSASSGAGALAAQDSAASGVGAVVSTGVGALVAQASTVAGAGVSVSTGTGAVAAGAGSVVGAGASVSTGTGSLVAGSAEVAGAGTAAAANSGALVADVATVEGSGVSVSVGTGALQATAAIVAGAGSVASTGTGTLVAGPATVVGEGVVLEESAVVGSGALVAGAATLTGEGEVTGEVAPPVFIGGGHFRPQPPRPFPIEGIGYGVLPQVEGEAHGLVVVAGSGAGNLPRPTGTGAGTVGVAGRSTARLAIKAAAVGDRGQVGAADAVLKGLSVAAAGVAGARGSGAGVVRGLSGEATGRHDDDEAAIILMLAA